MSGKWWVIAWLVVGCEQPPAPPEPTRAPASDVTAAQTVGTPTAAPFVAELRKELPGVIDQVAQRHNLPAAELEVKLTDDLQLSVTLEGRSCTRKVPEGVVAPELVTNFDHSLDRCVAELAPSR